MYRDLTEFKKEEIIEMYLKNVVDICMPRRDNGSPNH